MSYRVDISNLLSRCEEKNVSIFMNLSCRECFPRILEIKKWNKAALDSDEWTKLLKKARAHQGLPSQ